MPPDANATCFECCGPVKPSRGRLRTPPTSQPRRARCHGPCRAPPVPQHTHASMQAYTECGSPPYPLPTASLHFAPSHSHTRFRFPLPPLPPSSPRHRPAATHHRSSRQGSQWKRARSPVLPRPTSLPESQRAGRILAFPRAVMNSAATTSPFDSSPSDEPLAPFFLKELP
jgi:hypothetical protein